jgi:hypothetical protein
MERAIYGKDLKSVACVTSVGKAADEIIIFIFSKKENKLPCSNC